MIRREPDGGHGHEGHQDQHGPPGGTAGKGEKEQHAGEDGIAYVEPGKDGEGRAEKDRVEPARRREVAAAPQRHRHRERRRHLREDEPGVVDEWRAERHRPPRRLRGSVAAAPLSCQLAHLPREEGRQQRHEEGRGRVASRRVGGQDEHGQADRVQREDLAVTATHTVVRREIAGMERAVTPVGVVALQGHVVVAQQAVGDHEVVRLIPLGADLRLDARGHRRIRGEGGGKEQPRRRPPSCPRERDRRRGQRQGGQQRPAERAQSREGDAGGQQQGNDGQAERPCARVDARPPCQHRRHRRGEGEGPRGRHAEHPTTGTRRRAAGGQQEQEGDHQPPGGTGGAWRWRKSHRGPAF